MTSRAEVQFHSITLQDQRIRGAVDDYLMSVVRFVVQHSDGQLCPGCVATVRHRFRDKDKDTVSVMVSPPEQCRRYLPFLNPRIEEYYRERVGINGTAIRVGLRGASPLLIGVPRSAPAIVPLVIGGPR